MPNPESATRMAGAAEALLNALDATQRDAACFPFKDEASRRDWHYIPRRRGGLAFVDMTAIQQKAAYNLVSSGTSLHAFAAVTTIIGLEDVLDRMEGGIGPRRRGSRPDGWGRHRADYSTSLFGAPGDAVWGWRFEGHHVSINATVVDGDVASTPIFLGSNPAEIRAPSAAVAGGLVVTRPLAAEEEIALALLDALPDELRNVAMLATAAPDDILTEAAPRLEHMPDDAGVELGRISGAARECGEALVRHYVGRLPDDLAAQRWSRLEPRLGEIRFAFAGEPAHLCPQYYRLVGPSFLVEYDNTQNDNNHVHTVMRDPEDDFGDDLLRAHRGTHHHG